MTIQETLVEIMQIQVHFAQFNKGIMKPWSNDWSKRIAQNNLYLTKEADKDNLIDFARHVRCLDAMAHERREFSTFQLRARIFHNSIIHLPPDKSCAL